MLGIIIGISAVLTVLIIGDGMKQTVNGEMDAIGATSVTISLDDTKTDKAFNAEQIEAIEEGISNIYGVSPSVDAFGTVKGKRKSYDVDISGGSAATLESGGVKMVHGRYYDKSDVDEGKKVCVLSQTAANTLFGYETCVGEAVEFNVGDRSETFYVIGIREDTSMDTAFASYLEDALLMVNAPYTATAAAFNLNIENNIKNLTVYLDSEYKTEVLSSARSVVENVMGLRGENAVKISSSFGFDQTTNSILDIITSVVAIIAAISLLVGGIGVMNIMTVSVTERTREIGIRKSLGARTSSILTQFLAEAAILTFTGGIIGIIFGLSVAYIICQVVGFSFTVNPVLVLVVVAISTAIGLFFGIYPARRAAQLDPIEALRTE